MPCRLSSKKNKGGRRENEKMIKGDKKKLKKRKEGKERMAGDNPNPCSYHADQEDPLIKP